MKTLCRGLKYHHLELYFQGNIQATSFDHCIVYPSSNYGFWSLLASLNFLICNKTNGIRFTFLNPLSICNVCLEVITKTNLGQILEMFNDCYSCLSFTSVGFLFCICTLVLILLFFSLRIIRNLFIREKSNEILIWYRIVTIVQSCIKSYMT